MTAMILTRRSFITTVATALAMPAIVRIGSLMPVRLLDLEPLNPVHGIDLGYGDSRWYSVWIDGASNVILTDEVMPAIVRAGLQPLRWKQPDLI